MPRGGPGGEISRSATGTEAKQPGKDRISAVLKTDENKTLSVRKAIGNQLDNGSGKYLRKSEKSY